MALKIIGEVLWVWQCVQVIGASGGSFPVRWVQRNAVKDNELTGECNDGDDRPGLCLIMLHPG